MCTHTSVSKLGAPYIVAENKRSFEKWASFFPVWGGTPGCEPSHPLAVGRFICLEKFTLQPADLNLLQGAMFIAASCEPLSLHFQPHPWAKAWWNPRFQSLILQCLDHQPQRKVEVSLQDSQKRSEMTGNSTSSPSSSPVPMGIFPHFTCGFPWFPMLPPSHQGATLPGANEPGMRRAARTPRPAGFEGNLPTNRRCTRGPACCAVAEFL